MDYNIYQVEYISLDALVYIRVCQKPVVNVISNSSIAVIISSPGFVKDNEDFGSSCSG